MTFANPSYFILLLVVPLMVFWHIYAKRKQRAALTVSDTRRFAEGRKSLRIRWRELPFVLRLLVVVCLIVALARPQTSYSLYEREQEGIDVMLAMDISTSMDTPDLSPNRLKAAKEVAYEFINSRRGDHIGLTLFAGAAYLQCPLTTDHATLLSMFKNVTTDYQRKSIIAPGTAIGMGLSTAVSHLAQSDSKSKVVILLTDGDNNTGAISPEMAAEMAKQLHIRVYTILVGKKGKVRTTVAKLQNGEEYEADVESTVNPSVLRMIAKTTGGLFYEAGSNEKLHEIYHAIDELEKSKFKVLHHDRRYEAYQLFLLVGLVLFIVELLLRLTWLRRIP